MKSKLKIGILILCTFYLNISYAQDFWEELSMPDSTYIRCLTTNNQGCIFLGVSNDGNSGGLYRSTDNAQTWELVLDAGNFALESIAINENEYIYIGKTGASMFMISKDNGETWEEIELPPPSYGNIMKILCVGQDTIFVSSWEDNGAFLTRSFDSGETWEHSFITDHPNEYVSDIAISSTGDIFVSVSGFFVGQGGVYKSEDGGSAWEYTGLLNHQVTTIEINSNDDVFTGDWWVLDYSETPAIHALYEGADEFISVLNATDGTGIVINSEDHIYATANEGVVYSFDNGQTFEYIDDVLSSNLKMLHIGFDGFLYGAKSHTLVKSLNPIITSINANKLKDLHHSIKLFPNPVNTILNVNIISELNNKTYCEVCIYDLFGKQIHKYEEVVSGGYFQLDVSSLDEGFYLIKIHQNNKIYSSSFIKK